MELKNPSTTGKTLGSFSECSVNVSVAQSCPTLCEFMDCSPPSSSVHGMNPPGKNTGVSSHSLLQGIFPTQGSNPVLLHCRQILYRRSHQGSPYCANYYLNSSQGWAQENLAERLMQVVTDKQKIFNLNSFWRLFGITVLFLAMTCSM